MMNRRTFVAGAALFAGSAPFRAHGAGVPPFEAGNETPFSFEALKGWAQELRAAPYRPPFVAYRELIDRIDYDEYQEIRFKRENAIWANGDGPYPVELFHVGKYFKEAVRVFVVAKDGIATEIRYSPSLFDYGKTEFAKALPADTGFAGFRVTSTPGEPDWLAFLGASYFRTPGETKQYGLSSRGLAVDIAMPTPEEFPRFSHFWLEPLASRQGIVINALLDSPRVTGAYRIETTRELGTLMSIEAHIYPRENLVRAGIGPLTSMFWYGKQNRRQAVDWRPEIHDSDGLAIWSGNGERLWRPLNNPAGVQTSSFFDMNPKGFGLCQRERRFGQYEDDGTFYDRRPTVWVEPLEGWGPGAVQLVEIPTGDEIHDNIVAYWTPKEPLEADGAYLFRYKLHWRLEEPYPSPLARVSETRLGAAGIPGRPQRKGAVKYVVDFRGGKLQEFARRGDIEVVVTPSSGAVEGEVVYPVLEADKWRAMFDFTPSSSEPCDIRLYLRRGGEALSETWLCQHLPSLSVM